MTSPAPDPDTLRDALKEAVQGVLSQFGEFTTKYVVIVESVGGDGERGLWMVSSEGQRQWDTVGLLAFTLEMERASIVQRAIEGG